MNKDQHEIPAIPDNILIQYRKFSLKCPQKKKYKENKRLNPLAQSKKNLTAARLIMVVWIFLSAKKSPKKISGHPIEG